MADEFETPEKVTMKAYSVVAISFGARSSECHQLLMKDLTRQVDSNGIVKYFLSYKRSKARTMNVGRVDSRTEISGEMEVKALDRYLASFSEDDRSTGRLFRYLIHDKITNQLKGTIKPIGKNSCAKFGQLIATMLDLPFPSRYSGQCWRGTTATLCADAGMTTQEIKNVTGHKSTRALDVYVGNSGIAKTKTADALSLSGRKRQLDECESFFSTTANKNTKHCGGIYHNTTHVNITLNNSSISTLHVCKPINIHMSHSYFCCKICKHMLFL
jgi:hypothetical protein